MDEHEISDPLKINEDFKRYKKLPFSSMERELIVALVRQRPIIEDKRTHANNIVLKKQAWEDLAVAFNSQPYVSQRKTVQLKRCWENIKSLRKKELSQESMIMKMKHEHNNEVENSSPLQLMRKLRKETSEKKLKSELELRKKRCTINIKHDQELHELRIEKEKILIEREKSLLEYEKKCHELQLEKLKLEIDRLRNNNN